MTVQATFAATLVDEWCRCGLREAVVAPGSRSTPLALALADAADAGRLHLHVVLDERSAGFVALGLGLATGRPALVLTTSGTAAVELHPAVVEARHAGVPLLACTADRPPELRDVGAPQTIDQSRLFGGAARWSFDPGVADGAAAATWRSVAARAWVESARGGPVHLNLPFRDPLVGLPGELPAGREGGRPWHEPAPRGGADGAVPESDALDRLASAGRGIVVAGRGAGDPVAVAAFAEASGWPVLADPLSGCRVPGAATVAAFDALLRHDGFAAAHRPDAVLRLGAPPTSKVLAGWLAGLDGVQVAVVGRGSNGGGPGGWPDPERTAAAVVEADPGSVCWALAEAVRPALAGWPDAWARAEAAAQDAIDALLADRRDPTEPGVARALAGCVPHGCRLVVSSSMPVRDLEWYAAPREGLEVLANRGANGIDGVVSTAIGVACASTPERRPTVALLGDLAFLHDGGGLLGVAERGIDLTLVIVDNRGGGIFSFLPQAGALAPDRFERLFATPHRVELGALAAVHGIGATVADSAAGVPVAVVDALGAGGVRVVVVPTDRGANVAVHEELHAAVAAALSPPG